MNPVLFDLTEWSKNIFFKNFNASLSSFSLTFLNKLTYHFFLSISLDTLILKSFLNAPLPFSKKRIILYWIIKNIAFNMTFFFECYSDT